MKWAISNIAWETDEDALVAALLRQNGITAIECAPTKYWPAPCNPSEHDIAERRRWWEDQGIRIVAVQAMLFGRPELNLLGDTAQQDETVAYTAGVLKVGAALGATRFVFGSPVNRDRTGLSDEEATSRGIAGFRRLAAAAHACGALLCVEPNPPQYKCNYLTTAAAALELVQAVSAEGIALHLDSGIMRINGEDPREALERGRPWLRHFHVSEPELKVVGSGRVDHAMIGHTLRDLAYDGYVSVEMRGAPTREERLQNLAAACDVLRTHYHHA